MLKNAVTYWKTEGPWWVTRVAATKVVERFKPVLAPVFYQSIMMLLRLGYWPNIRNPRSFNEKIVHRQLFNPHPLASLLADKWRVREYVAERYSSEILNEVYFVTDHPEKIAFESLPKEFVIKANHGSGWNIFVTDKRSMNRNYVIRQCQKWLKMRYSRSSRTYENHYDAIKPVIIVEKLLENNDHAKPCDYKIHCFHGKVQAIDVISREGKYPMKSIFDRDWNERDYRYRLPKGTSIPRPPKLDTLIHVAECLSKGIDYCRVDLYCINCEQVIFGEITMSPIGGVGRFCPREWDFIFGELWGKMQGFKRII